MSRINATSPSMSGYLTNDPADNIAADADPVYIDDHTGNHYGPDEIDGPLNVSPIDETQTDEEALILAARAAGFTVYA